MTTCESEKDDKKLWHRRFRAKVREKLNRAIDFDEFDCYIDVHILDVSNNWDMGKDGRQRFDPTDPWLAKYMRK